MEQELAAAQTLQYAEEFRGLWTEERAQRSRPKMRSPSSRRRTRPPSARTRRRSSCATTAPATTPERVTRLALRLAHEADPGLAADPELEYGFLLHDVGKIGIPDSILLRPGPLSREERTEMEQHTCLGERIVARIPHLCGVFRQVIASHHEDWDGNGYPEGQAGARILYPARIFALVDAFDAMTNDRPYRAALPVEEALRRIEAAADTQFDPELALLFVELVQCRGGGRVNRRQRPC